MVCRISTDFHIQLAAVELGWPITWLGCEEIFTVIKQLGVKQNIEGS